MTEEDIRLQILTSTYMFIHAQLHPYKNVCILHVTHRHFTTTHTLQCIKH